MKKFKGKLGIICAAGLVCCACGKTDSGNGGALTGNADATAVEAEENIYTLSEIEYEKPKGANMDYLCQRVRLYNKFYLQLFRCIVLC